MPLNEDAVFKAYYKKVLGHLEELQDWIDRLVDTSGLIAPEERKKWFRLLGDALMGQEKHIPAHITPAELAKLDRGDRARIDNIGDLLRFLSYVKKPPNGVEMSYFWEHARFGLWRVIPFALEVATRISPERFPHIREIHDPFGGERGV